MEESSPQGPFRCLLTVSSNIPAFAVPPKTYSPTVYYTRKDDAKHNASLQFVIDPPQWLVDLVNGNTDALPVPTSSPVEPKEQETASSGQKEPEKPKEPKQTPNRENPAPKPKEKNKKTQKEKNDKTKNRDEADDYFGDEDFVIEEEEDQKQSKNVEPSAAFDEIIQELQAPQSSVPTQQLQPPEVMEKNAPPFLTQEFDEEYSKSPEKFIDLFEDGKFVFKYLNPGTVTPETGARVEVHHVGKLSDNTIFSTTFPNDQPETFRLLYGEVVLALDTAAALLKVGGDLLVRSHPEFGYGNCGLPPVIPPASTLYFYVKLVDAKKFSPTASEIDQLHELSARERIDLAMKCKERGGNFYNRKIYKAAADQYWMGYRKLYYQRQNWYDLQTHIKDEIRKLRAILLANIAAIAVCEKDWEKVLFITTKALREDSDNVAARIRRARVHIDQGRTERAGEDLEWAAKVFKERNEEPSQAFKDIQKKWKTLKANDDAKSREMATAIGRKLCGTQPGTAKSVTAPKTSAPATTPSSDPAKTDQTSVTPALS